MLKDKRSIPALPHAVRLYSVTCGPLQSALFLGLEKTPGIQFLLVPDSTFTAATIVTACGLILPDTHLRRRLLSEIQVCLPKDRPQTGKK